VTSDHNSASIRANSGQRNRLNTSAGNGWSNVAIAWTFMSRRKGIVVDNSQLINPIARTLMGMMGHTISAIGIITVALENDEEWERIEEVYESYKQRFEEICDISAQFEGFMEAILLHKNERKLS
jgi:hypothetical protein